MAVKVEKSPDVRKEVQSVVAFFSKESVLSEKGFISDPFVLMADFLAANPDNLSASLLFNSLKFLYRRYGKKSSAYIKLTGFLYEKFCSLLEYPRDFEKAVLDYSSQIRYESFSDDSDDYFYELGYSRSVIDAIAQADGSFLSIVRGVGATDTLSSDEAFRFECRKSSEFTVDKAKVYVCATQDLNRMKILAIKAHQENSNLIIICPGLSKKVKETFSKMPEVYCIDATPEYNKSEFVQDLKALVDQDIALPDEKQEYSTIGNCLQFDCKGTVCLITAPKSWIRNFRQAQLVKQERQQPSPLIKQTLQTRIKNLSSNHTILRVADKGDILSEKAISDYASEVLEISAIIRQGAITKINDEFKDYLNYPVECFTECFTRAAKDILYLAISTRVKQSKK